MKRYHSAGLRMRLSVMALCLAGSSIVDAATVTIDGSNTYQTIHGIGGHIESHNPYIYNTQFWDMLYNDIGVSEHYIFVYEADYLNAFWAPEEVYPMVRQARNHGVKFFQSARAPLAKWKDSGSETSGSLLPQYYTDYSYFCSDYIDYIKANIGVDISWFQGIGEPNLPKVHTTPAEYVNFMNIFGPTMRSRHPNVKIEVPSTWNVRDARLYVTQMLTHGNSFMQYIDIFSGQLYGWPGPASNPQELKTFAAFGALHNKDIFDAEVWYQTTARSHPAGMQIAKFVYHVLVDGNSLAFNWWDLMQRWPSSHSKFTFAGFIHSKDWPPGAGWTTDGITKQGHAFKQYAHWIRPGAVRIDANTAESNIFVSSYHHPGYNLFTTVAVNDNTVTDKVLTFNINNYQNISTLHVYRTSLTEDSTYLGSVSPTGNSFTYNLPKESITTFTTMPPNFDFYSPHVTAFTVNTATTTTGSLTFNWTITDDTNLKSIELWRTKEIYSLPDQQKWDPNNPTHSGLPDAENWIQVGNTQSISGFSADSQTAPNAPFTDTLITDGVYYYGLHAYDQQNNPTYEPLPGPLKVVKTTPGTDTTPPAKPAGFMIVQ